MDGLSSLNNILMSPTQESTAMRILRELYKDDTFADVSFSVGEDEELIKGHKCILTFASPVFSSMLTGSFSESKKNAVIFIPDVMPLAFTSVLRHIYLDEYQVEEDNWAPILYAAEKYDLSNLKEACIEFVKSNCCLNNVASYYSQGRLYQVLGLIPFVKSKLVLNADDSLSLATFLSFQDNELIKDILSCDDLDCDEIKVFQHALRWASYQSHGDSCGSVLRNILGPALFEIRFPRLSGNTLVDTVIPTGILKDEEILEIVNKKSFKHLEPISFPSHPRIRRSYCYKGGFTNSHIKKLFHAIAFKVDKPVIVHGLGIFGLSQKDNQLCGKMLIRTPGKKGPLVERTFCLDYSGGNESYYLSFGEPVFIHQDTMYTASLKLDHASLPVYMGSHGNTSINVDGVEWKFQSDPYSFETNIKCGMIQCISFTRSD